MQPFVSDGVVSALSLMHVPGPALHFDADLKDTKRRLRRSQYDIPGCCVFSSAVMSVHVCMCVQSWNCDKNLTAHFIQQSRMT